MRTTVCRLKKSEGMDWLLLDSAWIPHRARDTAVSACHLHGDVSIASELSTSERRFLVGDSQLGGGCRSPCHVVYTDYRPTPLQHFMYPAGAEGLFLVVDERGVFREDSFQKAVASLTDQESSGGETLLSTADEP